MASGLSTDGLDERSVYLRKLIVGAIASAGRGHLGPAMSLVEILRVLYDDTMRFSVADPGWIERDRMILSKGHGCLALYAVLADKGFFPLEALKGFCRYDSILGGHPEFGRVPGVEASTGALGHGLSIGVGFALAARMRGRGNRVFVVMGDGEINEGSVWEAAMSAAKHRLGNLVAIIDRNGLQSYGPTSAVLDLEPLADKWRAFGFEVMDVDGHDLAQLRTAFAVQSPWSHQPRTVICRTIKGRGIPAAEHNPAWHHINKLTNADLAAVKAALGGI